MPKPSPIIVIGVVETALEYDGPQLLRGRDGDGLHWLIMLVDQPAEGPAVYLAAPLVTAELLETKGIDLRSFIEGAYRGKQCHVGRWRGEGPIEVTRLPRPFPADWLPAEGLRVRLSLVVC